MVESIPFGMGDEIKECWDSAAEAWAEFVRTGKDTSREYMNNPGAFHLLGNIKGKTLLDIGCGEGYNTRLLAKKGATVTGVDFSDVMIKLAMEEEKKEPLGIDYHKLDATQLTGIGNSTFDIVTCMMVYMDFENVDGVTREIARVVKSNGIVIISMPHPCFEMSWENGKKVAGWIYENMDNLVNRGVPLYVKQTDYFKTGKYEINWNMQRLNKPFKTISFKRTLTDYFHILGKHGLFVSDLIEPKPTEEGLQKVPEFKKHLRVPQSIILKAVKVRD